MNGGRLIVYVCLGEGNEGSDTLRTIFILMQFAFDNIFHELINNHGDVFNTQLVCL